MGERENIEEFKVQSFYRKVGVRKLNVDTLEC